MTKITITIVMILIKFTSVSIHSHMISILLDTYIGTVSKEFFFLQMKVCHFSDEQIIAGLAE